MSVLLLAGTPILAGSSSTGHAAPATKPAEVQIALDISKKKISGGESVTGTIKVSRNGNTQELVFRLESSNPSLVRLATPTITIRPGESSGSFDISTAATPITTAVTIKAVLDRLQAQAVLDLVPAMLKGVTLSPSTLNGAIGNRITVRVELNANAPTGGIELYRQLAVTLDRSPEFLTLDNTPNPRVAAGSKDVTFEIHYAGISYGPDKIHEHTRFNAETRTVELIVSLEQQRTFLWTAIPGIAGVGRFNVIPMRVASISVQPASVTGGAEALATFTLNFPAGPGEIVGLAPIEGFPRPAWSRPLGSSCTGDNLNSVPLPLTPGVATYSFKICTAPVTAMVTGKLFINAPNGHRFAVPITVRP